MSAPALEPQPASGKPPPKSGGGVVLALLGVVGLVALVLCGGGLFFVVLMVRDAQHIQISQNNLKQIGLAVHNYEDTYKAIPLGGSPDPASGINMSWRVRLLPYIEQLPLHDRIDYNTPWDSPKNSPFHTAMPKLYCPPPTDPGKNQAQYLAFRYPQKFDPRAEPFAENPRFNPTSYSFFGEGSRTQQFANCIDGTSNTIMVAEADADRAVPWMKPADLDFDLAKPKAGLGNVRKGGFLVVMGDGSTRFIPNSIDDETLRRLVIANDGQDVNVPGDQ
jgi:hypothetical protein